MIGSFLWGWLGDRIGRRASILLAGVLFVATAICGSMPDYRWNFFMCFLMGLGVGGMLPITFALLAETVPARHRGWLMVLIGGDVAGAYIITSWLSADSPPTYGWRMLWLLGLPTGLVLILLNRWIPESPRFLVQNGREAEAREVMERYGATWSPRRATRSSPSRSHVRERAGGSSSPPPFRGLTGIVALLGLGVGLVTFGFQLWIPVEPAAAGFRRGHLVDDPARLGPAGFPATFLIAFLYGFWSSKKTMILLGLVTAASLAGLRAPRRPGGRQPDPP